jgi:hypothetical protein
MATITKGLFILPSQIRFLDNPTGPAYGDDGMPPFNSGDLLGLECYFFDPFDSSINQAPLVRYPGATITARLRAQGNDTIYATANQTSEIIPTVASVTRTQTGDKFAIEKQTVAFYALTGTFRLIFGDPNPVSSWPPGTTRYYPRGVTNPIRVGATAQEIQDAINAVPFYSFNGTIRQGPYNSSQVGSSVVRITNWTQYRGFLINFGSLVDNGTTNNNGYPLPLVVVDDAEVGYTYGWLVNLLLDGNGHTFADAFLLANSPAYFEVLLTPAGGSTVIAGQRQITAAGAPPGGGGGGPPPAPPPVLPTIDGVSFDGDYGILTPIGTVEISHGVPDDPYSLIYRQKYHQRKPAWQPLLVGDHNCPFDQNAIAVDETPWRWTTIGDIVEFERVWAVVPNSRKRPGSWSKTYKAKAYLIENGQPRGDTFSITSRTAIIQADLFYDYFNITAQSIPVPAIPDLAVVHNGPFHYYEQFGGFGDTNYGYVLIGVDTRPYMGPLWERLLVYGQ